MQAEIIKMVAMSPELLRKETILVRCKDCKYIEHLPWLDDETGRAVICKKHNFTGLRSDDWFCADGERRADP